jgi:hypothetical protein
MTTCSVSALIHEGVEGQPETLDRSQRRLSTMKQPDWKDEQIADFRLEARQCLRISLFSVDVEVEISGLSA